MIVSTIHITVAYAPDATREEAEDDMAEFQHEIERQFLSSVADKRDIHVDHTIAEVTSPQGEPPRIPHNHFGEVFVPATCPACKAVQDGKQID